MNEATSGMLVKTCARLMNFGFALSSSSSLARFSSAAFLCSSSRDFLRSAFAFGAYVCFGLNSRRGGAGGGTCMLPDFELSAARGLLDRDTWELKITPSLLA